jgi:hypothetical protein
MTTITRTITRSRMFQKCADSYTKCMRAETYSFTRTITRRPTLLNKCGDSYTKWMVAQVLAVGNCKNPRNHPLCIRISTLFGHFWAGYCSDQIVSFGSHALCIKILTPLGQFWAGYCSGDCWYFKRKKFISLN